MLTLQELNKWLEDVEKIIIDLNISVQNAERLTIEKYDFEKQIKKHGFFQHHWYQLKFIMVVQLSKLLGSGKNDKRSFNKLCNVLENKKYNNELKNLLFENSKDFRKTYKSRSDVVSDLSLIREKIARHEEKAKKIISARNQFYAHRDPNPNIEIIRLADLQVLINLCSEIYNHFKFKFFWTETYLKDLSDWSIDYTLWYMSEMRKKDDEERKSKIAGLL